MEAEAHRQCRYLGLSHATLQFQRAAILHLGLRLVQESDSRKLGGLYTAMLPTQATADLYMQREPTSWNAGPYVSEQVPGCPEDLFWEVTPRL